MRGAYRDEDKVVSAAKTRSAAPTVKPPDEFSSRCQRRLQRAPFALNLICVEKRGIGKRQGAGKDRSTRAIGARYEDSSRHWA